MKINLGGIATGSRGDIRLGCRERYTLYGYGYRYRYKTQTASHVGRYFLATLTKAITLALLPAWPGQAQLFLASPKRNSKSTN